MTKDKKSMDDVLDSIRKIIRTDPTAAPPDASTLPRGGPVADQTARDVLDRLRREKDGGGTGKPLSTSDDPDESARAILEHLRQQAEAEAQRESAGEAAEAPPDVDAPLDEPPQVDGGHVPVMEEKAPPMTTPRRGRTSRSSWARTPAGG